ACGADLTEEADSGYTPMDLAVALGHKKGNPAGYREPHPEAVPEQEEEEVSSSQDHHGLTPTLQAWRNPGISALVDPSLSWGGMAAMPEIQGHSFQPWLGS
ncbi:RFXK protein, partial [Ploceus nigricollis]|nr:RFXK protein [Ploceus nigricollis]